MSFCNSTYFVLRVNVWFGLSHFLAIVYCFTVDEMDCRNTISALFPSQFNLLLMFEPHHEGTCLCKCEHKDADQLPVNCVADQRLCFRN